MVEILGLAGFAGCGKNAIAEAIATSADDVGVLAFADPVRALARRINPIVDWDWNREDFRHYSGYAKDLDHAKRRVPEVRRFLQELGTGARAVLGDDVWLNVAADTLATFDHKRVIITDVRFANEAEWIQRRGGTVVRIIRPGTQSDGHFSERQEFPVDITVFNDGPLSAVVDEVREVMMW